MKNININRKQRLLSPYWIR